MQLTADETDRFWSHIVKGPRETDCWVWIGAVEDDGYGRFWVQPRLHQLQQRVLRLHRVAWALAAGESIDHPPVVEHVVEECLLGWWGLLNRRLHVRQ